MPQPMLNDLVIWQMAESPEQLKNQPTAMPISNKLNADTTIFAPFYTES